MFTTRPEIRGTFGCVASTHWIASQTGMAMLEKGGNAFDAAVAAGFVLQVVEPHLNGPGGEVPMILSPAGTDRPIVLCGQGPAPAAATLAAYRDLGLDLVPGTGLLAMVIPGAFDAWMLLLRDHGRLDLETVIAPAIAYARDGHPLLDRVAASIAGVRPLFETAWPSSAATWLPRGAIPQPGALFRNPVLAETYTRIVREAQAAGADRAAQIEAARAAFYRGFVAEAIGRFCADDAVLDVSGRHHRGLLTAEDMAGWQASYEAPVSLDYHGWRIHKTDAWGQGPVLLQALALLRGTDIAAMDPMGADFVHTVLEAIKLAFADREVYYGDPQCVDVPLDTLLGEAYAAERRRLIGAEASHTLRPGTVPGFEAQVAAALANRIDPDRLGLGPGAGEPTMGHLASAPAARGPSEGDTCHIDVVDREGNMIAATPSGGWLQSSPTVPELGFCLNTRAQMFWLTPGLPASLAPGKRPRTTLSPSLAEVDGRPALAFGTPGGDQQDQWQLAFILRHIHAGLNLQAAIDAPLFHTEHFPLSFYPRLAHPGVSQIEGRFASSVAEDLRRRGHALTVQEPWSIGRLCAAGREGPVLKAAATPRLMQAYAVGR